MPARPQWGRRRRLLRLANLHGIVVGLALDHRDSFRIALAGAGFTDISAADIRRLKRTLVQALAAEATAVMLDEEFGRDALVAGDVPPHVGLVTWVLLGGRASGALVVRQLRFAAAAGAAGFLAGRSIWGAAIGQGLPISPEQARQAAQPVFLACRDIAMASACPLGRVRSWS